MLISCWGTPTVPSPLTSCSPILGCSLSTSDGGPMGTSLHVSLPKPGHIYASAKVCKLQSVGAQEIELLHPCAAYVRIYFCPPVH